MQVSSQTFPLVVSRGHYSRTTTLSTHNKGNEANKCNGVKDVFLVYLRKTLILSFGYYGYSRFRLYSLRNSLSGRVGSRPTLVPPTTASERRQGPTERSNTGVKGEGQGDRSRGGNREEGTSVSSNRDSSGSPRATSTSATVVLDGQGNRGLTPSVAPVS